MCIRDRYVTASPCIECSKLIIQAGIKRVVYSEKYRLEDGIDCLLYKSHGQFNGSIEADVENSKLIVNGQAIRITAERNPADLKSDAQIGRAHHRPEAA